MIVQFQKNLARMEQLQQHLTHSYECKALVVKREVITNHYLHASSYLQVQIRELLAKLDRGVVHAIYLV